MSDELGILASPLCILRVRARDRVEAVAEIARKHEVTEIVVGFPLTLRGEIGPQARRVERFVEDLRGALDAPVRLWDEQYSTAEARDRMAATRKPSAGRRGRAARLAAPHVDAVAAAVILQEYLDWRRSSSSSSP
ncbi:MAG: Holliday junction resolvase YqgF [Propionibacteriaceae bacterium]|jgi:putative Holliday junction resolvase|nr:Holliday junction resolvase YqgF [Propionibacteriaceae bacterium]